MARAEPLLEAFPALFGTTASVISRPEDADDQGHSLAMLRHIATAIGNSYVIFFKEEDGGVPIIDWLDELPDKAQDKCLAKLKRLEDLGHELRRPEADILRDEIYELRLGLQGLNYRMLYFFHGREAVVISHGLVKERVVPSRGIDRAAGRKRRFETDPKRHTFSPET